MTDVSVIIPLYNGDPFILEAIDSCLKQTGVSLEILVIDDGSTDGGPAAVRALADKRVRLLAHPGGKNEGVSATRWLGIREATGEFIAFLDADDGFCPGKLKAQINLMRQHPTAVLCHTAAISLGHGPALLAHFSPAVGLEPYRFLDSPWAFTHSHICNSSVVARGPILKKRFTKIPQLFQYEDWLNWCLLGECGEFIFLPEPLTRYRQHDQSFTQGLVRQPLRKEYAYLEFLLALRAHAQGSGLREHIDPRILRTLHALQAHYGQDRVPEDPGFGFCDKNSNDLAKENVLLKTKLETVRKHPLFRLLRRAGCFRN